MTRRAAALLVLLPAPALAAAGAGGFEDVAKLQSRVIAALDADIGQPGGPVAAIDRRLKLAACPVPVTIDPPALGALPLRCEPLGWRLRVPLVRVPGAAAVQAAAAPASPPPVIRRGDPVQLFSGTDSFTVSTAAIAQEDGRTGGRVRVKTDSRGPVIIGEVVDIGRVRAAGF